MMFATRLGGLRIRGMAAILHTTTQEFSIVFTNVLMTENIWDSGNEIEEAAQYHGYTR